MKLLRLFTTAITDISIAKTLVPSLDIIFIVM